MYFVKFPINKMPRQIVSYLQKIEFCWSYCYESRQVFKVLVRLLRLPSPVRFQRAHLIKILNDVLRSV